MEYMFCTCLQMGNLHIDNFRGCTIQKWWKNM